MDNATVFLFLENVRKQDNDDDEGEMILSFEKL